MKMYMFCLNVSCCQCFDLLIFKTKNLVCFNPNSKRKIIYKKIDIFTLFLKQFISRNSFFPTHLLPGAAQSSV